MSEPLALLELPEVPVHPARARRAHKANAAAKVARVFSCVGIFMGIASFRGLSFTMG